MRAFAQFTHQVDVARNKATKARRARWYFFIGINISIAMGVTTLAATVIHCFFNCHKIILIIVILCRIIHYPRCRYAYIVKLIPN